jgi:GWxTD domain-containing protein
MKKISIILILVLGCFIGQAQKLNAILSHTSFYAPDTGPYIETYLSVEGNSIQYAPVGDGKFQGTIEVVMLFKQKGEIINFDKFEIKSPLIDDTSNVLFNVLDQQRYLLANGGCDFEIWLSDQNSKGKPSLHSEQINISYPSGEVEVSGVELLSSLEKSKKESTFTKNGFELIPYVNNFYPAGQSMVKFYVEIYNSNTVFGENSKFLINYYIESFETARKLEGFQKVKRQETESVVPLLGQIDIENLPSGNYKLVVEARNKENELVAINKVFFQRSNPNVQFNIRDLAALNIQNTFVEKIQGLDTLKEYIRSLAPISSDIEKGFAREQLLTSSLKTMQQYFLNFWQSRDNLNPYGAWQEYSAKLKFVNEAYATQVKMGYETDRGRVWLQYGQPNIITESYNEPSAYPYEIWQYYQLGETQRNKRFVYMSHDMVTNNFELIHSDAIGELSNYRWQIVLHRGTFEPNNYDVEKPDDAWGNNAEKYYNDPF